MKISDQTSRWKSVRYE